MPALLIVLLTPILLLPQLSPAAALLSLAQQTWTDAGPNVGPDGKRQTALQFSKLMQPQSGCGYDPMMGVHPLTIMGHLSTYG